MTINEAKYNKLFLEKFKANPILLDSEFKRIITQFGYSDKIKFDYYSAVFDTLIV